MRHPKISFGFILDKESVLGVLGERKREESKKEKRDTHTWACTRMGEHTHKGASMHWAMDGIEGDEESWKNSAPNSRTPLSPSTFQRLTSTLL